MSSENKNDTSKKVKDKEAEMDRGFAWIILLGSFFMHMLILGNMKSFGVLYTEMLDYYSSGSGNTAWIGSIAWLFLLELGPFASLLSKNFGYKKVTVVGGAFVGIGYFLSGFVQKMELMYLTFTLCGIGYGLTYIPCSTIINFYFEKRRALANGILVSSSGLGALCFPFLYKTLIETYGLLQSFWIIGAVAANICVAGCVFRQPYLFLKNEKKTKCCNCRELDFKFSLLRNPLFTVYVFAFTFSIFGHVNNSVLIPAHIKALGYDKTYVALGVSISGGVEIFARILFGWFADLKIVKVKNMLVVSMFIGAVVALITPFFESFTFMAIYAVLVSFFPASFLSLMPLLTIEAVGVEDLPAALGIICMGLGFACFISPPICGWMEDYYGNWYPAFVLTGSMFFLAGFTVLMEPLLVRLFKKQSSYDIALDASPRHIKDGPISKESLQNNNCLALNSCSTENNYSILFKDTKQTDDDYLALDFSSQQSFSSLEAKTNKNALVLSKSSVAEGQTQYANTNLAYLHE